MASLDWKKLEKAAREQGWKIDRTKKGIRLVPPDPTKAIVIIHGSPSEQRGLRNKLSEMKRSGLIWPWPPTKGSK